jgi:hypothetical protein
MQLLNRNVAHQKPKTRIVYGLIESVPHFIRPLLTYPNIQNYAKYSIQLVIL